ncbi:MAG: zinc-ribbon domain-containing protein [Clostridiales bacterium]|nr:zinc-ribbon domain-containing protein [Clostridiales bacterium]
MAKFCTNCGKQLNPDSRFCTKCGTPIGSESAPQQQSYTGSYTPPTQQGYVAQNIPPVKSGGSGSGATVLCIVLAAILFLQVVIVALFGWPGFLAGGKTGRRDSFTMEPNQTLMETKTCPRLDFGTYKAMADNCF